MTEHEKDVAILKLQLKQAEARVKDYARAINYIKAHIPEDCTYIISESLELCIKNP